MNNINLRYNKNELYIITTDDRKVFKYLTSLADLLMSSEVSDTITSWVMKTIDLLGKDINTIDLLYCISMDRGVKEESICMSYKDITLLRFNYKIGNSRLQKIEYIEHVERTGSQLVITTWIGLFSFSNTISKQTDKKYVKINKDFGTNHETIKITYLDLEHNTERELERTYTNGLCKSSTSYEEELCKFSHIGSLKSLPITRENFMTFDICFELDSLESYIKTLDNIYLSKHSTESYSVTKIIKDNKEILNIIELSNKSLSIDLKCGELYYKLECEVDNYIDITISLGKEIDYYNSIGLNNFIKFSKCSEVEFNSNGISRFKYESGIADLIYNEKGLLESISIK